MPPKARKDSIYDQYFTITNEYINKYGENTILFYQVGAFFEMYGVQTKTGDVEQSRVGEFTQIAQLNMSSKEIDVETGVVIMAGFRDYSLEKYLKIATSNNFTAVVYTQNMSNPKNITREFQGVYSPGTYISYDTESSQQLSNNIVCIWLTSYTSFRGNSTQLVCGISSSHIFTGESTIFEYETPYIMNPTTFDELERCISILSPSEAIVISSLTEKDTKSIIQYSGLRTNTVHKVFIDENNKNEIIENCQKQKYISHIISKFFGEDAYFVCKEFQAHIIATQSFCYLLNFLQEHNADLVRKITIPTFNNSGSRMVLANHTLKQLNIIDDDTIDGKKSGKLSSVLSFLNNCCNPIGRRMFQTQLTNPVFDEKWLNTEYDMIENIMGEPEEVFQNIRKQLRKIRDMEKICRQIVTKKVYPNTIYLLYESVKYIGELHNMIKHNETINGYLGSQNNSIETYASNIIEYIDSFLEIDRCKSIETVTNITENIIKKGMSDSLDKLYEEYKTNQKILKDVHETLNRMMQETNDAATEYVKIHETEKSGSTLQITKKRGELLRQVLKTQKDIIEFSPGFKIPQKDIRFIKAAASTEEIEFPQLTNVLKKILVQKEYITEEIARAFAKFLRTFEELCYDKIESLIKWTGRLDVLQSKGYMAKKYNYCKPKIDSSQERSYFNIVGLRHVLIEHIQQNEIYVTNDLTLSNESCNSHKGILIFGTNAVGKTSFIRAVGITIIMAQAGLYVPCQTFTYKPYTAIFSRILGNDNIFKGLSTFAVEMSELRIILKMANENSLVLGDELCSGTEVESALALFSAGLIELHKKDATFLFATHFHEITKYEEIQKLEFLGLKHMSVHYDKSRNTLIYDRILKEGQGSRMYGLEVCKSLYMEEEFLELAYSFRNKYFPDKKGDLNHTSSRYNADKIRGMCQICKIEIAKETHHLNPQKNANDANGYIDSFHKNHKANLASVCEKCHDEFHKNGDIMKIKKSLNGYIITEDRE